MKTDLYHSCSHCWVFHFAGILNAALSKHRLLGFEIAHLEFHHLHLLYSSWCFLRPTWLGTLRCLALGERLSGSLRSFLYSSSVYSCHLFLISSASVKSILFLSFIVPIFAWSVPLPSLIFLKRSLVFPILLFSSTSLHWSLRKAFLPLLAILWNSVFKWIYLSFLLCL